MKIQPLTRYDNDVATGISNVIKEQHITDLIIGLQPEKGFTPSFVHNLHNGYLQNNNVNTLIYHASQPISTVKRYLVIIPANAQQEAGFFSALLRVWNIAKNSGATMSFYADESIISILQRVVSKSSIEISLHNLTDWKEAELAATKLLNDEGLIVFMAKRGMISYFNQMSFITDFLNQHIKENNFLLLYPSSKRLHGHKEKRSVSNHDDFAEIGHMISKIFS